MLKKLNSIGRGTHPPLVFVQRVLKSFMDESGLEPTLFGKDGLKVVHSIKGSVTFQVPIQKGHTNRLNILHGGTIASMVDLGGSLAVASMGLFGTGVSTDLNVTYLGSGGKVGDTITAVATCDKFGKNLAYTTVIFKNAEGEITARGSHTKYIKNAWKSQHSIGELYTEPHPSNSASDNVPKTAENGSTQEIASAEGAPVAPQTHKPE